MTLTIVLGAITPGRYQRRWPRFRNPRTERQRLILCLEVAEQYGWLETYERLSEQLWLLENKRIRRA